MAEKQTITIDLSAFEDRLNKKLKSTHLVTGTLTQYVVNQVIDSIKTKKRPRKGMVCHLNDELANELQQKWMENIRALDRVPLPQSNINSTSSNSSSNNQEKPRILNVAIPKIVSVNGHIGEPLKTMSRPIKYNKQLKPIDNVIAIADTVEGMETCFTFDTSNSGPVSYDMEVSTDDLVDTKPDIKPEIMYFKKDLISNTAVLGVPPASILLHPPQDLDSIKHLLSDDLPRCGALLSVYIRNNTQIQTGEWVYARVLRVSKNKNPKKRSVRFRLVTGEVLDSFYPNPDIRIVIGVYNSVTVNDDIGLTCLTQSERANTSVQQLLSLHETGLQDENEDSDSDDSSVGAPLLDDEEIDEIGIDIYSLITTDNVNTLPLFNNTSAHSATTDATETQLEEEVDAQAKEILFNQHCQEIDEYLDSYCRTVRLVMSDDVGTACKDEPPQHVSYVPIRGEDGNEEMIPLYDDEDPLYQPPPPDAVVIGRIKSMRKTPNEKWKIKINDAYVKLVNKDYVRKDISIKLDTRNFAFTKLTGNMSSTK